MDEQAYLEPDFDPTALTMPRLRSILVAHNVNYPSSAKKGQLVDLFNEHVRPQARKILSANARVKRTSRGIVDVASSQGTNDEEEVEEVVAPPTRTSRRSTRARTEEIEEIAPTPRKSRHSTAPPVDYTPRRSSSKHARPAEVQEEEPATKQRVVSRQSRPSAAPVVDADGATPFSSENVFQAGSSPPPQVKPRDTERRRTTMTTSADIERRRSRDARRRTEEVVRAVRPQTDGAVVPTRSTFDPPAPRSNGNVVKYEAPEYTEEFTPDEQEELIQSQQKQPSQALVRAPRPAVAKTAPLAIITAMLLGLATVWRQEKVEVGYCGVGHPSTELAGVHVPDWADILRPQCEPCPPHAYCGEHLETTCEADFVLTPHPLAIGGVVPLAPTCEPDSAKAKKVSAVKDRAVEVLRERNAAYECGTERKAEITERELKQALASKRSKRMSGEEFEELWGSAMGELHGVDEVVKGSDGSGYTLRSTSLARLPLACAIRRSLRETLRQYVWFLVSVLAVLASGAGGYYKITSGNETETKVKQLAGLALNKLSEQASLHAYDPDSYSEDYISMAQLRDDVLREEWGVKRRKVLWEKVQKKVEGNANVRAVVREGRSGDVGRVWEWVGAVSMIEGGTPASAVSRRKSGGRVSFGGERRSDEEGEMTQVGKWTEGGQYY